MTVSRIFTLKRLILVAQSKARIVSVRLARQPPARCAMTWFHVSCEHEAPGDGL
ncbi:hypothetical protein [Sagittula sp. S175]|uniref:hypothetical protein n=1 Tax=Sagittula sp. S175 TaxID=3415129 RepID=UPI003C7DA48A